MDPIETSSAEAEALAILMVASEATPYSKTGGLADVAGSLPRALDRLGHRVTLVLPRYRGLDRGAALTPLSLSVTGSPHDIEVFEDRVGARSRVLLLDSSPLYDREGLYGVGNDDYPDNPLRFAVLARAALELAARTGDRPSLIHAHDWQGGLVSVYLKTRYASDVTLRHVPSVFTIHNLAYQGTFDPAWMSALDLGAELLKPDALEFWGRISFLKGGIQFSDAITTVSPRYAREILTHEGGFGFEGVLASRKGDLVGILNGIDIDVWDPSRDPFLPEPFDAEHLDRKAASKRALLSTMRLPVLLDQPVIGMVSRMVEQKGHHLLVQIGESLASLSATFVILGSGEARFEDFWKSMASRFPDRIAVYTGYHERLAHLIEGGADMFLMPSLFEPCGLNQMYSHRYGTVPIVRATGGLDDTVEDYDGRTGQGTGFKFKEATGPALLRALRRARAVYPQPEQWRAIQLAGMRQDHSWDVSAREYVKVYRRVLREAASRVAAGPGRGAPVRP